MRRALVLLVASAAAMLAICATALADFGFKAAEVGLSEEGGAPATLAGSHPFAMSTKVSFNTAILPGGQEIPDQQLKDLITELPPGLIGNPKATARCSGADFGNVSKTTQLPHCSDDAVVGLVSVSGRLDEGNVGEPASALSFVPVYNLEPGPGEVAKLGFVFLQVPITIDARLTEHAPSEHVPYKIVASLTNASEVLQLFGADLILWGDPASSVHDPFRGSCLDLENSVGEPVSKGDCPVSQENLPPFLTLPRSCGGPLETDFTIDSWTDPNTTVGKSASTPAISGCSELEFEPQVALTPGSTKADSPSGIEFNLDVKDPGLLSADPGARAQSDVKKVVTTLPPGFAVNPSLASGLAACTSEQIKRETAGSAAGGGCPSGSRIGDVEVQTPLLDQTLAGSVFVAKQQDNPFGSLLALYVVLKNPALGVSVSLAGKVEPDPKTGQITATFDELPQIPFSHFELRFREGPRAPLITPGLCGDYAARTELTPWAAPDKPLSESSTFHVGSAPGGGPCTPSQGFGPSFEAGTLNPVAGAFSPLSLRLRRGDGSQRLSGLEFALPEGLIGKLAGIPYCGDGVLAAIGALDKPGQGAGQIASPSCPAASQIGTATVGAGAGPSPVYVSTAKVYLAGPYKGAPLSAAIVTPAVTGPFDLGNVVVRAALYVDPATAQIRTVSDPIPTILQGIPLDLRDIQLNLDRPGFTLNPTSCEEAHFSGTATSEQGARAPLSQRFQVGSCGALGFKPKLSLKLSGSTNRAQDPALKAVLTQPAGQANIDHVSVVLPKTELIDNRHIGNTCTRPRFAAGECPPDSVLGRAKAWSPLLDQPLEGLVYFRANGGERSLPDLVAALHGQIDVNLVGFVDSVHRKGSETSRVRTTFAVVPDAPVSRFVLELKGGKQGLLQNGANLCKVANVASVKMTAQNGKVDDFNPLIGTNCAKHRPSRKSAN